MTSGQNAEREYSFPHITGDEKLRINNPDSNATINFMMQEIPPKDFAGATVTLKGENNEEISLNIRGVNCRQLAKIMDVLEQLKGVIGSQQFEIPSPPPYDPSQYPWYPYNPYYPTNPFTPNITWSKDTTADEKQLQTMVSKAVNQKLNEMETDNIVPTIDEDVFRDYSED